MAKRIDEVLVVDIESTCWDGQPPQGQVSDIIEIGLCRLDVASGERLEQRSLLVRPDRSTVSDFCTNLTTITPEMLADAIPFSTACSILRKEYDSRDRVWASYGDYDRRQFERQCQDVGVSYPFGPTHMNVKTLYALAASAAREVGMATALEQLGLPLVGTHHRGVDDAANIAAILSQLLQQFRADR